MVRTNPDVDVESFTTDRLCDFINDAGPVAANLPDDAPAADQITANVEAAIDELRSRRTVTATDGGTADDDAKTVADFFDDDEWQANVTDKSTDHKIRHKRSTRTRVEDGVVVHKVVEQYADDAAAESLSFKGKTRCPVDDHDTERDISGDDNVVRFRCREDGCPFEAAVGRRDEGVDTPTFFRVTVPDDAIEQAGTIDFADAAADKDDDDTEVLANAVRTLSLGRYVGGVNDKAHVSAEYDDDHNKTADAYIDTTECARCGDEVEAPATKTHAHFGEVCPSCEDAKVWSPDDADLPDDVEDRMGEHKTFNRSNIVAFLRDVAFYGDYVARMSDEDDAGFDGIKTGKQGKRDAHAMGRGRKGTGLRRPNGAAHGKRHFRTVLRDLVDTDLIERTDDGDTDVDDPNAHFVITDKGRDVLRSLARCETCGDTHGVFVRHSTYKAGRRTKKSTSLSIGCDACDHSTAPSGAMVLDSSGETHYERIGDVDDV